LLSSRLVESAPGFPPPSVLCPFQSFFDRTFRTSPLAAVSDRRGPVQVFSLLRIVSWLGEEFRSSFLTFLKDDCQVFRALSFFLQFWGSCPTQTVDIRNCSLIFLVLPPRIFNLFRFDSSPGSSGLVVTGGIKMGFRELLSCQSIIPFTAPFFSL